MINSQSEKIANDVILACKILVAQNLDSGPFGNVSIRIPNTNQFWINPNGMTFDQLSVEDLLLVDTEGNILYGKHPLHPGEFIHREMYILRKDVSAIVHTHSENTTLLSLLACEIEPYTQLGASLYGDQGIYEGFTGPVRTSDEGKAIAFSLGNKSMVIAKNHGIFTTGATIQCALWDFVIADTAAKIHLSARQLGLTKAEIISAESLQKSKVEVRHKQNEFMWKSFVKNIENIPFKTNLNLELAY